MTESDEAYVLVVCGTCGARLHPRRELIGKRVRCPDCGVPVRVVEPASKAVHVARDVATVGDYKLSETDQPVEQPQTVLVTCGTCSARLHPRVELVGKRVRCPDCGRPVLVRPPPKAYPVKAPQPVGQYRVGSEPEPNPAPFTTGVHLPDQPLHESHPLPAAAPRYWFFTGVFTFPWTEGTIGRWVALTVFCCVSGVLVAVVFASLPTLSGSYDVGSAFMVPMTIALSCIVWAISLAFASGCAVAVLRDAASGLDEVTDWSDAEIREGIWRALYIAFPTVAACALAYGVYFVGAVAWPEQLEQATYTGVLLKTVSVAIAAFLAPIMMLSALEQGAWWLIISRTVLGLIFGFFGGWILVNIEVGILTLGVVWIASTAAERSAYLTALLGAPLFAAVILIDARLFGRFLYRANEVVSSNEPTDEDDQHEAESDEPRA